MKKLAIIVALAFGLAGCSSGPGDADVQTALQTKLRDQVQEQMNVMNALGGKSATEAAQALLGMPKPEDIEIQNMDVDEATKQDNGDYVVKATFKTKVGDKVEPSAARLTLTKLNNEWKVVAIEKL
ncbi:MAG: hypothetical protein ACK4FF_09565 [Limnobacter sp.]|uniref:hypothetical protein n=1 Tax=Limnobacter sp. TaxID=2003368 RepID=UPI00391CC391